MSRVPEWLVRIPIAHRGLHNATHGVIENSLPAFWAASRAGYPAELDVRLLADGEVVVFHDATLDRLTGAQGPISALTSHDLRGVPLSGAGGDEARIPLLRDVLDLIAGSTPLLVEVKNEGHVGELEERTAALLAAYPGAFAVQSFHPGTVAYWRRNAPAAPRGLLSGDFRDENIDETARTRLRNLESIDECEPDFVGYDIRLLPNAMVERQRAAKRCVLGWTARTRDDATRALTYCDNIIFEGFDASVLKATK